MFWLTVKFCIVFTIIAFKLIYSLGSLPKIGEKIALNSLLYIFILNRQKKFIVDEFR